MAIEKCSSCSFPYNESGWGVFSLNWRKHLGHFCKFAQLKKK